MGHSLGLGLDLLPKDDRDFSFGNIFGDLFSYKPLHEEFTIPTLSVKIQTANSCGWVASTAAKEVDEKVLLSPRSMVCLGKRAGLISGDGFSNLRALCAILLNLSFLPL